MPLFLSDTDADTDAATLLAGGVVDILADAVLDRELDADNEVDGVVLCDGVVATACVCRNGIRWRTRCAMIRQWASLVMFLMCSCLKQKH